MVDECKQSTTTSTTHVKENFQVNTFHIGLKACRDLYRHCVCPRSYLKHAFSIYKAKLWQSNRGSPSRSWTLSNVHNHPWVGPLQWTAFEWWRHGNRGLLLVEQEFPNYARFHRGRMEACATCFIHVLLFMALLFMIMHVAIGTCMCPVSRMYDLCFAIYVVEYNLINKRSQPVYTKRQIAALCSCLNILD